MRGPLTEAGREGRAALALPAAVLLLCLAPVALGQGGRGGLARLIATSQEAQALLQQGSTGERTQRVQQEVVEQLDALIAALRPEHVIAVPVTGEEGEAELQQPGSSTAAPVRPAEESTLPAGRWGYGRLRERPQVEEAWLPELPATERKKIADAFATGRLPPRYRELLRQYNKRLAEDGPAEE